MIAGRVGEATPVGITQNTAILPEPEIAGTKSASLITNPFQTERNAIGCDLKGEDPMKEIRAGVLNVAYLDIGPAGGPVAVLLHGFPYDVHAYDKVADELVAVGCRCIIPYPRGYGGTQFIS